MVVISCPSELAAKSVQESMETPSTSTVQAPQEESSHPRLDPVRSRSLRNTSSSNELGSIANSQEPDFGLSLWFLGSGFG